MQKSTLVTQRLSRMEREWTNRPRFQIYVVLLRESARRLSEKRTELALETLDYRHARGANGRKQAADQPDDQRKH